MNNIIQQYWMKIMADCDIYKIWKVRLQETYYNVNMPKYQKYTKYLRKVQVISGEPI